MRVTKERFLCALCLLGLLSGCAKEPPPPSVAAFMENQTLLDAAMVQCTEDRAGKKYDAECVNAREAVDRLAVERERARREQLDAEFERKRQALRRAQEAAAEVRRRAREAAAQQAEAEYLFGTAPEAIAADGSGAVPAAGAPGEPSSTAAAGSADATFPAADEVPALAPPVPAEPLATGAEGTTDLEAVRETLQQRQEEAQL